MKKQTLLREIVSLSSGAGCNSPALAPLLQVQFARHIPCPPSNQHSGNQPSEDSTYEESDCDQDGCGHVPNVYESFKPAHCRAPNAARVAARNMSIHVMIEGPAIG